MRSTDVFNVMGWTAEPELVRPLGHGRYVSALLLAGSLPVLILLGVLISRLDTAAGIRLSLFVVAFGWWAALYLLAQRRALRPLQTLANLLGGLRRGDYSMRASRAVEADAIGLALVEANALADHLREQRLSILETTALLRKVIAEIEVAVFAFDEDDRLRLVNPAGARLLGAPAERLRGLDADELGLRACLTGDVPRKIDLPLLKTHERVRPRWELRRTNFRQQGRPHVLLVVADVSRVLREEERMAWERLVRVLSHEINNSLAPIRSVADSLREMQQKKPRPVDWEQDTETGLELIAARAEALSRFMASYARLARLPPPRKRPVELKPLVDRIAALERRVPIRTPSGPLPIVQADPDQLEQLLINLLQNAVDAALEAAENHREIEIRCSADAHAVELAVLDRGSGLPDSANLFVPFFSTKPGGSGIGLNLCRQIAEAHGGNLDVGNRADGPGCSARVRLPRA